MEMKFFRKTAGYILLGLKTNEAILGELGLESVEEKNSENKSNWFNHV